MSGCVRRGVEERVPQLGTGGRSDHRGREVGDVGVGVRLVEAADDAHGLPGQHGRHQPLTRVGGAHERPIEVRGRDRDGRRAGRVALGQQLGADAELPGGRIARSRLGHGSVDPAVGVEALREDHDCADATGRCEHGRLRLRELGAPDLGVVRRPVDAVVHRDRAVEGHGEALRAGDVDAPAVDEGVDGAAARPGQQADLVARTGDLEGDGRADGTGSGDDVDGVHGCSWGEVRAVLSFRPWCTPPRQKARALLS